MKKKILLLALFIAPSLLNAAQQMTAAERLALKCAIETAAAENKKQEVLTAVAENKKPEVLNFKLSVQDLLNTGKLTATIVTSKYGTKSINLDDLGLTSLKGLENIPGIKEIETFSADKNNLTDIENIFNKGSFPKLGYISFAYNNIATISPQAFANFPALRFVNLSNNRLTNINGIFNDKGLKVLNRITLENNSINSIDSTTFRGIPKLESLNLKNNKISSLKDFLSMPHLHTRLPKDNEHCADKTIIVKLNENPLPDSDEDSIEAFNTSCRYTLIDSKKREAKKETEDQITNNEKGYLRSAAEALEKKIEEEHPIRAWLKKVFN